MPSTLYGDETGGIMKQITIGLATAAVLGVWAFATTRASSQDVKELEVELKATDAEFKTELKELQNDIHELEVHQSAFRAQVREALRIPHEPSDSR
tara:strand:+ start:2667 stop:2954 length:288 start_codon:yes stop_codon:yes gene_type:complete